MIAELADVLKRVLDPLKESGVIPYVHGLSKTAYTPFFSKDPKVLDTIPIVHNANNIEDCCKNVGLSLIPNRGVRALAYFEENGATRIVDGSHRVSLNLIVWFNELGYHPSQTNIDTKLSSGVSELYKKPIKVYNSNFQSIKIEDLSLVSVEDTMGIFRKYTYFINNRDVLMKPFGYFCLSMDVKFSINVCNITQLATNMPNCF